MLVVSHLRARRVLTLYCIRYTGVTPSWPRGLTSRSAHARTHEALCAISRQGWQSQKCRVNRSASVRGLNISAARGLSKERRVISLWTALYMPPALCSKLGSRRGGGGRLAPCSRGALPDPAAVCRRITYSQSVSVTHVLHGRRGTHARGTHGALHTRRVVRSQAKASTQTK